MAERQGLFVIISLGEVITAALSFTGKGQVEQINNNRQSGSDIHKNLNYPYLPMLQTVLLAGAIKFMYFDLADVAQPSTARTDGAQHALARSTQSGVLWLVLHAPLNAAITITGSFLKSFVTEGTLYHWYVTVSMSVAIFCTIAMRLLCHGGNRTFFHRKLSKYYREFVWFAGAIILAVLPAMFGISECKASSRDCNAENFLGVYIVLLYGLLAVNIWARHPRNFRLFEDIVGWERRKDAHDHNVQHPSSVTLIRPATEPVERHSGPDDDSDYVLLLRGSEELPGGNTARQRTTALLNNLTPEVLK